ncbi:hypothetical protein C8F04DRAFT_1228498 [Mycena alexandri]|uniref:Uncharacterized protein n=1 Tax=Mycena alexandri TaxID=1745969 RepID=A0AAD6TG46_9AGAR|nr:hypothetical protein C8F04DRAFT_1228498 [Mycena alexandri]
MTTSCTITSPGKPPRQIRINSPTIRALNSFYSKGVSPDLSWDDEIYVRMRETEAGEVTADRDRPEDRHKALKQKTKLQQDTLEKVLRRLDDHEQRHDEEERRHRDTEQRLRDEEQRHREEEERRHRDAEQRLRDEEQRHREEEKRCREQQDTRIREQENRYGRERQQHIDTLKTTITGFQNDVVKMTLVEKYEVLDSSLRAYNDFIFNTARSGGLTVEEKYILRANGLPYILQLLDYEPQFDWDDPNITPVETVFRKRNGPRCRTYGTQLNIRDPIAPRPSGGCV